MRSVLPYFGPALFLAALGATATLGLGAGCGSGDTQNAGGAGGHQASSSTGMPGTGGTGGTAGGGTGGGGGGASPIGCPNAPKVDGCTVAVAPSSDDYTAIQTAFETASSGDTVCLCPGTFEIKKTVSVNVEKLTVRGAGAKLGDTVLDFKKQTTGKDAFDVTSNDFDVENFTMKNTPGNGIVTTGVKGVTFKDLKVYWDAGSDAKNGAYAVYPVSSQNVLIDGIEVVGASDAGIYVGQSVNAIVRNSKVHGCVAGIESENTTNMEVYQNEVYDNTAGILIFALPNLTKKDALDTNAHDNNVHDNNRANFNTFSVVQYVPSGIGILILAADYAEIHANTITNQNTVGLTMVSLNTFAYIDGMPVNDPNTDPYPEHAYIYDNTYTNCGNMPSSPLDALPTRPVEDIVWDGDERMPGSADLCLGTDNTATFRDVNGIANIGTPANQSTDPTPFLCAGKVHPPVTF